MPTAFRPYEPAMMVMLLLYGYASGTFSSRRIARARQRDIGFRYLAAGNTPAHRTICEFRRRHLGDFANLFVQVVRIAREMGLSSFGTPALDGSKVKASASRRKAMSYDRMLSAEKRLRAEIAGLLERAAAEDLAEDGEHGIEARGDEIPQELKRRRDRLQAIAAAKQRFRGEAAPGRRRTRPLLRR